MSTTTRTPEDDDEGEDCLETGLAVVPSPGGVTSRSVDSEDAALRDVCATLLPR